MSTVLHFDGEALRRSTGEAVDWPYLAVLGDPVEHSLSPRMHAAALRAARLPGDYAAVRVAAGHLDLALRTAFESGVKGLNLTLPHKQEALRFVERASEEVTRIGAANSLVRLKNGWSAHNTDARGFAMALQALVGRELADTLREVHVIGAGGAARAVAAAVRSMSDSSELCFLVRQPEKILWASEFAATLRRLDDADLGAATLVVQATPLGLNPEDPNPVAHARFPRDCVAVDLTYSAQPSSFLRAAAAAGCRCEGGGRMLVAQGALSFTMWFGGASPVAVMAAAIDLDW